MPTGQDTQLGSIDEILAESQVSNKERHREADSGEEGGPPGSNFQLSAFTRRAVNVLCESLSCFALGETAVQEKTHRPARLLC
jgi:hypothetical protein